MRKSSERLTLSPMNRWAIGAGWADEVLVGGMASSPGGSVMVGGNGGAGRSQDAVEDALVPGASADVARQRLADLGLARFRVLGQQRRYLHEESGCAEAALEPVGV